MRIESPETDPGIWEQYMVKKPHKTMCNGNIINGSQTFACIRITWKICKRLMGLRTEFLIQEFVVMFYRELEFLTNSQVMQILKLLTRGLYFENYGHSVVRNSADLHRVSQVWEMLIKQQWPKGK